MRKGLSKLATYTKACASATGGGHLPPKDPPKVCFTMTDAVRDYAASMTLKLNGMPSVGDSDPVPPPANPESSLQLSPMPQSSQSVFAKSGDAQFFPTNTQRAHSKKKRAGNEYAVSAYGSEKSTLLTNENKRREELHVIDVQLKQQELLIKQEELKLKQKINLFWDLAIEKMSGSSNIAATMGTATAMQRAMQCAALHTSSLTEADIQFTDGFISSNDDYLETMQDFGEGASNVAHNVVVEETMKEFIHQSPIRVENMYEEVSGNESSATSSMFDDEENDQTFDPDNEM